MVAFSSSPSQSVWTPAQHGVDMNGYVAQPPLSPGGGFGGGDTSTDSKASRNRRGSSPGKRALNWFRSRSASPASVMDDGPPSPSSFVVRKVIKQPGGVSHLTDVHGSPVDSNIHETGYPYQTQKSRPISLGVPPGGPGGGTGYGTAKSSNDGRPEPEQQQPQQQYERGRSRSKSPNRPPSPGAITAGAFRGGRIAPGPLSSRQAAEQQEDNLIKSQQIQKKRLSNTPSLRDQMSASPLGPRSSPFNAIGQMSTSPNQQNGPPMHENHSRFSVPVHIPHGSGPPPVIPLEGIPSPVKVPLTPTRIGASPLGSASPAGSPGYFGGGFDEQGSSSQPNSPHFASKWFKGLFGKSPRLEDRDDGIYSNEAQWMRQGTSPNQAMIQQNPNAWSDGMPLAGSVSPNTERRRNTGNETFDSVEAEAMARKKHSMMMAARIEDEHRNKVMSGDWKGNVNGNSSNMQKSWIPPQVIESGGLLTQEPEEWDPPQSKSPPGRKPPPRFTASDLQAMSQIEREKVATEIDPEDTLSKLEGRLTPAQQIIAETRSKMMAKDEIESKGKQSITTHVQKGFDTNRRSSSGGVKPPTLPSKSPHGSQVKVSTSTPAKEPEQKQSQVVNTKSAIRPPGKPTSTTGLTAGQGPLPSDMPLGNALQEMMVRFYRFERYAVPLMRSLEGRLVDVERDNQMALNGDGMSANSARDREMDRWVGQMTQLMKHEVGQLQAATRELRESRELLASVAKSQGVSNTSSGFLPGRSAISTAAAPTNMANKSNEIVEKVTSAEESRRGNNISTLSFKSAVRKPEGSLNGTTITPVATTNANISPNGRPRYTHALGRPMHEGKISPMVSPRKEIELSPSPAPSEQSSISRRAMSVDERLKALVDGKVRSPSINTQDAQSSIKSAMSLHGHAGNSGSLDGSISDDTSFENVSLPKRSASVKIGDDYQLVMAREGSEASAISVSGQSTTDSVNENPLKRNNTSSNELRTKQSKHLQTPSNFSTQTDTTIKPMTTERQRQTSLSVTSRAISTPSSPGRMPLSPNLTGNSLKLATPTRQGSTSPASMVPNESSSAIKTASHASKGLRARAQSYLQNAEQPIPGVGSGTSSANISASNSSSWNQISNSSSPKIQTLKTSSSTSILKDRSLNNLDKLDNKNHFSSSSSDEVIPIKPLNVKKSTHSIKSTSKRSDRTESSSEEKFAGTLLNSSNFDTIKGNSVKSGLSASNSAISSPSKPSIKDRVAFFDAQRN